VETGEKEMIVEGLTTSVGRLDEVIRDLNYVLQVKHLIHEKKELINFNSICNEVQQHFFNIIMKDGISIEADFTTVPEMHSYKTTLYSVFMNLIANSIKFRQANVVPFIRISSAKRGDRVILTFKDNGLGIDLETHGDELFGFYRRFHSHVDGKGMGLYIVKTQVEALGGSIAVQSNVGDGATFTISLPLGA